MKPIRIITPGFELRGEIDDYASMWLTRSWHGIGQLELRINRYKKHVEHLVKGNLIMVSPTKVFLIRHREIELNEQGKASENWIVKGLALKSILGQRITVPPSHAAYDNKQGNSETVMKHYVDRNAVNPIDSMRKISQLNIGMNHNRGTSLTWQSRYKNLAEELADISLNSGTGWDVMLDNVQKKWDFDVKEGRILTASQKMLPPVIFSPEFDAVQSLQFTESDLNYKNMAFVGGQGEGIDRRIVQLGNTQGLNRHEIFIDARDVEEKDVDDQPLPESTIIQNLTDRGSQKLQEYLQEQYLEGQILTYSPFKYEKDYDLGDIVTVQSKEWGVTLDSRITEIKEIYETDGFKLEATFGNNKPTLIKKIKQELAQISGEVRR